MTPAMIEQLWLQCNTEEGPSRSLFDAIVETEVREITQGVETDSPEAREWERISRDNLFKRLIETYQRRPEVDVAGLTRFLGFCAREIAGWRLLALWHLGDSAALSRLFEIFEPLVRRAVRLWTKGDDADDTVQQVWLRIVRFEPRLDPSRGTLQSFIGFLARNTAISSYRSFYRRADRMAPDEAPAALAPQADGPASLNPSDLRLALSAALKHLSDQDRVLIEQHYISGLTLREIAETSGASPAVVTRRLTAARERLRNALQGQGEPHGDTPDPNVRFTAYFPTHLVASRWYTVLVYVHLPTADAQIRTHSLERLGASIGDYRHESDGAQSAIHRGAEIVVIPDLPGIAVNPPSARVLWLEDWHAVEFRLNAPAELLVPPNGEVCGRISFFVGPILIADIQLSVRIIDAAKDSPEHHGTHLTVQPYHAVFVSYSHKDSAIAEELEKAYKVLGLQYLRDIRSLRSGERWNQALLRLIAQADIFQLLWSSSSKCSRAVKKEWQYALTRQRPFFIRPVYWEKPMPRPPRQLADLHFAYLELAVPEGKNPPNIEMRSGQ